jgi:hypothetical protein
MYVEELAALIALVILAAWIDLRYLSGRRKSKDKRR